MKMNEIKEEEIIYEGIKTIARIIAQAVAEEILTKEKLIYRRATNASYIETDEASGAKKERLTMSVNSAAKLLGLSRSATYQAVHSGQIPCIRFGSRILIPRVALMRFLNGVVNDKEPN